MQLTYSQILTPFPFSIGIGHLIPPTVGSILKIGEDNYNNILFYIIMDTYKFYDFFIPERYEEYCQAPLENKKDISLFQLVCRHEQISIEYERVFNFFFTEIVHYNKRKKRYELYKLNEAYQESEKNGQDKYILHGVISEENFTDVLHMIAQLCNVTVEKSARDDMENIKSKAVLDLLNKIENAKRKRMCKGKVKKKTDPKYEFGNIMSVVCAYGNNGVSCHNIADITIANLYDQFSRIVVDRNYSLSARNVSVWGDKDKNFKYDSYLDNLNKA